MRILSTDVFQDVLQQCNGEQRRSFCIVMRTAERKRQMKENFRRYRERYGIHIDGDMVIFDKSRSRIHICCLANRPKNMYDELIVDDLIADEHAIETLRQVERHVVIVDLGAFEPSTDILEYIGGVQ